MQSLWLVALLLTTHVYSQTTNNYSKFFGTAKDPFNMKNKTDPSAVPLNRYTNETDNSAESNPDCLTKAGDKGVCVPYYLCDASSGQVITDGATLIDIRFSQDCAHYLQMCCITEKVLSEPAEPKEKPGAKTKGCGWTNPGAQTLRILSYDEDSLADFGEFPWMIALLKNSGSNTWAPGDYLGGGSLIHPQVVLTVAHKVYDKSPEELRCRAGEFDTQTTGERYKHQDRIVKKIIYHDDFFRTSVYNNVALLILEEPFNLTKAPHIDIGCIGKEVPPPNTKCYSMGWGKDFENKYSVLLKKVELPTVARGQCQNALRQKTKLGQIFQLHVSLSCAGGKKGQDTCTGDGGSPLVCPMPFIQSSDTDKTESGRFGIFGMVSYGLGCGEEGIPGVYANVPMFYNWVVERMEEEGFTTRTYDADRVEENQ